MRLVVVTSGGEILQALQAARITHRLNAEIVLAVLAQPLEQQDALPPNIKTLLLPLDAAAPATIAQNIQAYQPDLVVLDHRAAGLAGLLAQVSQKMMMSHPALPGEFLGDDAIGEAYDAFQRGDILSSGVTIYTLLPNSGDKDVFLKAGVPMLIEDTLEDFATRMQLASQQLLVKALALYAQKYYPSTVN